MKIFKKLGFLALMIVLLAGAFVLPKFVQRASPDDMVPEFVKADQEIAAKKATELLPDVESAMPSPVTNPAMMSVESAEVLEFFEVVQQGEFPKATTMLMELNNQLPEDLKKGLTERLASAQAAAKAQADAKIQAAEKQASKMSELENSIKELAASNQNSAKLAAETAKLRDSYAADTAKLREELETVRKKQKAAMQAAPIAASVASEPEPLAKEALPETVTIGFDTDSSVLKEKDFSLLEPAVSALNEEPRLEVQLRGYADSRGDSAYNGILALARAEAVKDFLIEKGVPARRVSVVSFGETQAGSDTEDMVKRRVEVRFR